MKNNRDKSELMKIGELAKASGVSVSTLKFYAKEGLIQPAVKTGPNMAWYDPDCVSRIRTIKSLQKERYYPLGVIKRLLDSPSPLELELLDAIHKVDPGDSPKTLGQSALLKAARLTADQLEALIENRLAAPTGAGRRRTFSEDDLKVALLIRRRMDAGIPFAQSVDAFKNYLGTLEEAARFDVDCFIKGVLLAASPSTEDSARMIRISDQTLDDFISLKRSSLNSRYGADRIADLGRFSANLSGLLPILAEALNAPLEGFPALGEALRLYGEVIASTGLAQSVAACGRANAYFSGLKIEVSGGRPALALAALRLGWLYLAPPLLGLGAAAEEDMAAFPALAQGILGPDGAAFCGALTAYLGPRMGSPRP